MFEFEDSSAQDYGERDLVLARVRAPKGAQRSEIFELGRISRGKIVDVGADELIVEISGRESKVQAFIERIRPFGITQLVRTGRIALVRGGQGADTTGIGGQAAVEVHS